MDFSNAQYPFQAVLEHGQARDQRLDDNPSQPPQQQRLHLLGHPQHHSQPQPQQYLHHSHPEHSQPPTVIAHPLISFQTYPPTQHVDGYYPVPPQHPDHQDFATIAIDHDEFDATSEILTKPRLTKDQVDVLEMQFQAHAKPNSNTKRQLAIQTGLTLPRVANWFQNRRAKAKQMKKQEEFELSQGAGAESWQDDAQTPSTCNGPLPISTGTPGPRSLPASSSDDTGRASVPPSSAGISSCPDVAHEASWASLHRALDAAHHARPHYHQDPEQTSTSLPGDDAGPTTSLHQPEHQDNPPDASNPQNWVNGGTTMEPWSLIGPSSFGKPGVDLQLEANPVDIGTASSMGSPNTIQGFHIPTSIWTGPVTTSADDAQTTAVEEASFTAEPLPMPGFPSSSSNSPSDELSSNLGQFVLTSTPPMTSPVATNQVEQLRKPERHGDIAARRKAPRPATLGPAALGPAAWRSQSSGSQSALSSTFRVGRPSQHAPSIRHAKSVGHSLNVRYAGIRKPSPAQRSPLNIASFAEADEFSGVMTTQPGPSQSVDFGGEPCAPPTPISNEEAGKSRASTVEERTLAEARDAISHQLLVNGQPAHLPIASPPSTPLKAELLVQAQMQSLMPPLSAPPQYAFFPDYTPPYSAGPLTASSWSDAPLTSPEIASFSGTAHLSSEKSFLQPGMPDYGMAVALPAGGRPALPPNEQKANQATSTTNGDQTQTEFLIQEFPRQKEEHAHAALQMASQKPKSYVFANATPNDF